jgi:hypothetical protein
MSGEVEPAMAASEVNVRAQPIANAAIDLFIR